MGGAISLDDNHHYWNYLLKVDSQGREDAGFYVDRYRRIDAPLGYPPPSHAGGTAAAQYHPGRADHKVWGSNIGIAWRWSQSRF